MKVSTNYLLKRLSIVVVFGCLPSLGADAAWAGGIPVHGKWCGPGHGFKGAPIDAIDQLCKGHDYCVRRTIEKHKIKKYVHVVQFCRCDRPVIKGMPKAIRQTKSKKARYKGKLIRAYFKRAPCMCMKRICHKKPLCKKVKKCKKVKGKQRCTKVRQCKTVRKCKSVVLLGRGGKCPQGSR